MNPKRDLAVFTICQNEPKFLPVWSRYYRTQTHPQDLYVLDHDSSDLTTIMTANSCCRVPVHRTASFAHDWLRTTVSCFQKFLLQSYRQVLFVEADEIVAANPEKYRNLLDFVQREPLCSGALKGSLHPAAVRCRGFEVVHTEDERPINWEGRLLQQRKSWAPSQLYSKTLLANCPLTWSLGFHSATEQPAATHEDLALIHLHRLDYESCARKHVSMAGRAWEKADLSLGLGRHNRLADPETFRTWFYNPEKIGSEFEELKLEPIPEMWQNVV